MQVLSCALAQVRDSFSRYEGGSPEAWILTNTGRPTKKTHGDRVPSGRPVDFGSNPGQLKIGRISPCSACQITALTSFGLESRDLHPNRDDFRILLE
jgi:hypothetical protein